MSAPEWWQGLPAIEAPGVDDHRFVWTEGTFILDAHPDPEAERTLGALGAPRCVCLDVLDAWEACHDSGGMLIAGPRSGDDAIRAPVALARTLSDDLARWRRTFRADVGPNFASVDRTAARRLGFLLLLGLDARFLHRLQASVAAVLDASGRHVALEVATAARALPALAALGWTGLRADIRLGPVPSIEGDLAILPASWMASVWGRGLVDAVEGRFVVEVTARHPEGGVDVIALAPGKSELALRVDQWETRDNEL